MAFQQIPLVSSCGQSEQEREKLGSGSLKYVNPYSELIIIQGEPYHHVGRLVFRDGALATESCRYQPCPEDTKRWNPTRESYDGVIITNRVQ